MFVEFFGELNWFFCVFFGFVFLKGLVFVLKVNMRFLVKGNCVIFVSVLKRLRNFWVFLEGNYMCDICLGCLVLLCMKLEWVVEFVRIKLIGMNYFDCVFCIFLLICFLVLNDFVFYRVLIILLFVVFFVVGVV